MLPIYAFLYSNWWTDLTIYTNEKKFPKEKTEWTNIIISTFPVDLNKSSMKKKENIQIGMNVKDTVPFLSEK